MSTLTLRQVGRDGRFGECPVLAELSRARIKEWFHSGCLVSQPFGDQLHNYLQVRAKRLLMPSFTTKECHYGSKLIEISNRPTKWGRLLLPIGSAIIISFGLAAPSSAQHISSLESNLVTRQCPRSEYRLIDADKACGGVTAQKSCDQKFSKSSRPWLDCRRKIAQCADEVAENNRVIALANRVFRSCHHRNSDAD
jgi:hypothetical protein